MKLNLCARHNGKSYVNPFYNWQVEHKRTFSKWNWIWLWCLPTYTNIGESLITHFKIHKGVIYIVGEEDAPWRDK